MHDHEPAIDADPAADRAAFDDRSDAPDPDIVPAKFRDPDSGAVRVDALVKSYRALERKLGAGAHLGVTDDPDDAEFDPDADFDEAPEDELSGEPEADLDDIDDATPAEDYAIETDHPWLESDPEINAALHDAGFTEEQAQLVYDLAAEKVVPLLESLVREIANLRGRTEVEAELGGPAGFEETARQLRAWGEANLPPDVYQALAASPNGVRVLRRLMASGEPALLPAGNTKPGLDEAGLRRLMDDPRYWRDAEPGIVRQVEDGFRRLYPER
jgi:hypothetical protein